MGWAINLWGRAQGWLAAAGAVLLAVGIAFLKGRAEGKKFMEAEQQRKRDELQRHYDEIDSGPADPGRAYDSLRQRSDE